MKSTRVLPLKRKRRIAMTGAAGFIGTRLLRRLQADDSFEKFVLLDIRKPDGPLKRTKFYKVDLTEPTADAFIADILKREKCDIFVHLAFLHHPTLRTSYAHELESIGTMYVLNACGECGVPKIVVSSTTLVYGAYPSNPNFLSEDHPLRAGGFPMLRDRVEIEQQIRAYRSKHSDSVVTVLRPCLTLGPTVQNFVTRYLSLPFIYTVLGYDPLMQFVHEDDVIRAFHLAVEQDFSGEYNIVGKGVLPASTLIRIAGKINLRLPSVILYPMMEMLWLSSLAITPIAYLNYIRYIFVADGIKAAEEMGFEPQYSTKETLEHFIGKLRLRRLRLADD